MIPSARGWVGNERQVGAADKARWALEAEQRHLCESGATFDGRKSRARCDGLETSPSRPSQRAASSAPPPPPPLCQSPDRLPPAVEGWLVVG